MSGFAPTATAPFGGGLGMGLKPSGIEAIVPIAQNRILVQFVSAPTKANPLGETDALNSENYAISASTGTAPKVVYVRPSDRVDEVELMLVPPMVEDISYTVTVSNAVASPSAKACSGPTQSRRRNQGAAKTDISAPQTQAGQPEGASQSEQLGTTQADGKGDYALASRRQTLRKRIYRILVVNPGTLTAHPDFGLGIEQYKSLKIKDSLLQTLSGEIKKQLTAEPDIRSAYPTFRTERSENKTILVITNRVVTTDGLDESFDYKFDWEA